MLELGSWGARSSHRPTGELSVDALMAALESTFAPDREPKLHARYELRLGEERYYVEINRGNFAIARGRPSRPDVVIDTDPATLRALVFGDRKLAGAPVEVRGDAELGSNLLPLVCTSLIS